jgi:RNA polymerase sigma-70 factor (ECF subfamily)
MANRRQPAIARRAEYEQLYDRHHRDLWAVAYARLGDANLAMELMQEAFLRLWKIWPIDRPESPKAWLVTVVRNLAEDEAKSSFRRNGTHAPELLGNLSTASPTAEDGAIRRERREQVRNALSQLADLDREILTMKYGLERETTEIAEALGIQPSAVYMRLSRARQHLAAHLGAMGE